MTKSEAPVGEGINEMGLRETKKGFKDTNPKDAVGTRKMPMSTVPSQIVAEIGVALLEGARKYGRHNYRVAAVRSSVYYDGAMRHLQSWWEGEDIDPDSGLPHVTKAMASLTVLRDAQINGMEVDDRPPRVRDLFGWRVWLQSVIDGIFDRHPDPVPAYTHEPEAPDTTGGKK